MDISQSPAPTVPAGGPVTAVQESNDWWRQYDQRVYECIELWWEPKHDFLTEALGEALGQEWNHQREAIEKIRERVVQLETTNGLERASLHLRMRSSTGPRSRRVRY